MIIASISPSHGITDTLDFPDLEALADHGQSEADRLNMPVWVYTSVAGKKYEQMFSPNPGRDMSQA